jgi:hypothetical protein
MILAHYSPMSITLFHQRILLIISEPIPDRQDFRTIDIDSFARLSGIPAKLFPIPDIAAPGWRWHAHFGCKEIGN